MNPRHGPIAQLLITWSPLSVLLVVYAVAAWVSAPIDPRHPGPQVNRLGLPLHMAGPARADRAVFGVLPTTRLQDWLYDGTPHWYDAVAALVYVTHFVAIPVVTTIAWFWLRPRFRVWLVAILSFIAVGVIGYVVYPAAPPWLAAQQGVIAPVHRLSNLGWDRLHLRPVGWLVEMGQAGGNPVAAMPSLHAGSSLLVTIFLWPTASGAVRALLVVYVVVMGLTLVYTGEHYVVDVVAGWGVALLASAAPMVARRLFAARPLAQVHRHRPLGTGARTPRA